MGVYIDEQYDEALRLIEDSTYEVKNKVDVDKFYKASDNLLKDNTQVTNVILRLLAVGFVWLVGLFIVILVIRSLTT